MNGLSDMDRNRDSGKIAVNGFGYHTFCWLAVVIRHIEAFLLEPPSHNVDGNLLGSVAKNMKGQKKRRVVTSTFLRSLPQTAWRPGQPDLSPLLLPRLALVLSSSYSSPRTPGMCATLSRRRKSPFLASSAV